MTPVARTFYLTSCEQAALADKVMQGSVPLSAMHKLHGLTVSLLSISFRFLNIFLIFDSNMSGTNCISSVLFSQ